MSEQLFFIHIPKTGGTTWRSILLRQYKATEVCAIYERSKGHYSVADVKAMDGDKSSRYKAFIGHVGYGLYQQMSQDIELAACVLLRDPVSRSISLYNHFANDQYKGKGFTVRDYIESQNVQFDNGQMRYLTGENAAFGACNEAMFQRAIQNLESFHFVGITESLLESFFLATRVLAWRPVGFRSLNRGTERQIGAGSSLDTESIRLLREYNAWDQKLYESANVLFRERLEALGADWRTDFSSFQETVERLSTEL